MSMRKYFAAFFKKNRIIIKEIVNYFCSEKIETLLKTKLKTIGILE